MADEMILPNRLDSSIIALGSQSSLYPENIRELSPDPCSPDTWLLVFNKHGGLLIMGVIVHCKWTLFDLRKIYLEIIVLKQV